MLMIVEKSFMHYVIFKNQKIKYCMYLAYIVGLSVLFL